MPNPPIDAASLQERFRLTQIGNAERLVSRYGMHLRYCHAWGKWLVWDGKRWKIDDKGAVGRAQLTVRSIHAEADNVTDSDVAEAIEKHAKRSESRYGVEAMIVLARSQAHIPVLPSDLDRDPWLFNCENGTLDLRTGK